MRDIKELFHRRLRVATLSQRFEKYFRGLKARSRRFMCSVQRVCVSWFGNVTFLGVVVVWPRHKIPTRTIGDPPTVR